jgi:DNA-binding MarR family transcriptional regulator
MANTTTTEPADPAAQSETLIQQISRTYYDLLPAFERFVGMSKSRWGVLALLHRRGELSQAYLQQRLYVDGAAITRQVKQLEAEGLVLRRADPHDNRFTLVALTEAGRQITAGMNEQRDTFEALMTGGINAEEIAMLRRCLQQIRENLDSLSSKL